MIDDGLPAAIVLKTTEERRQAWATRPSAAPPARNETMKTETAKPSKSDQVAALRVARANRRANPNLPSTHPANRGPKARKAKAAKPPKAPAKAKKDAPAPKAEKGGVRPGSKLAIVVGLLTRKEGCTSADILKATDWPAVSVPQQARAAGLTLRQEKDGKVTRYWAA